MSSPTRELLDAAAAMAESLRTFKRIQIQARERGDEVVELHVAELFEAKEQAALDAYEKALADFIGARPLPMEVPA